MLRARNPILLIVAAAASWGAGTVTSKYALRGLSYTDLLAVELGVAAPLLVLIASARGQLRRTPHWRAYAALGFFEPALAFALFNAGLAHTGAVDGALLISLENVFLVLLAVVLLGERPRLLLFAAVAVGFAGAALVSLEGGSTHASVRGDLLILASALGAAMFGVLARRVAGRDTALTVTTYQFVFGCLFVLPLVLTGHSRLGHAAPEHIAAAAATGLLGSAIPFLLYNFAAETTSASRAAVALNFIPVFGVAAAFVVLGERPGLAQLAGGALILGALALAPAEELSPAAPCPPP